MFAIALLMKHWQADGECCAVNSFIRIDLGLLIYIQMSIRDTYKPKFMKAKTMVYS